jgi:antirestriction protein ArdC
MRDMHREITDKILAMLKTGVAPWRKPWSERVQAHGSVMPRNAITGRFYSGANVILLWSHAEVNGWGPRWLTFKQARAAGGNVRKGEHGVAVIFVNRIVVRDKKDPDAHKSIGFLKAYTVFNTSQCDGLPDHVMGIGEPRQHAPVNPDGRDEALDAFVQATEIRVIEEGSRACYSPALDRIAMPAFPAFKGAHPYYATLFHEMGHATGHKSRLDRNLNNKFGDRSYAAEELIAELTSAFVCAEWGIDMGEAPASYIETWVSLLEERETAIITAASAASKAVEWLRGAASAEEADEEEEASTGAPALLEAA